MLKSMLIIGAKRLLMKYRKIDKNTVQCIVTGEDMEEYGLSMTDIFERNERGEGFLRDLIEEAREEVGYTCQSNNIAMQISPFKDNGMVITFSEEPESAFKSFLEHMKGIFESSGAVGLEDLPSLSDYEDAEKIDKHESDNASSDRKGEFDKESETRIFEFDTMNDCIQFCKSVYGPGQIKSCLVKSEGKFYMIVIKNRMSWKNFNKMSASSFDFAKIIVEVEDKLFYLGEHGEMMIPIGAVNKLSKL